MRGRINLRLILLSCLCLITLAAIGPRVADVIGGRTQIPVISNRIHQGNWRTEPLRVGNQFWWHDPRDGSWRQFEVTRIDPSPMVKGFPESVILYPAYEQGSDKYTDWEAFVFGEDYGMFVMEKHDGFLIAVSTEELTTSPPK